METENLFQEITDKAATIDPLGYTVKFLFEDDSLIYIDGTGDKNEVSTKDDEADSTITIKKKSLANMMSGKLDPMIAFMSGRIKVKGSMGVALKLQSLFKSDDE